MESYKAKKALTQGLIHLFLIVFTITMLVPFLWMVLTAFKTQSESTAIDPFVILPSTWHFDNFGLEFPGKKILFAMVLIQMMVPAQIFIIPQYIMVSKLKWINTIAGLVFPGAVTAFGTFLLKQGYQGLPKDLEEAASIDGCNIGQQFLVIMMPLTRSSMVSLGIFTAVFAFKDLMWPMIVCSDAKSTTLSAGLAKMQGQFSSNFPQLMAAATMACLPMIVLYLIFQKQFVEGIATSGGKL